jgi:hypothetical protein
MAEPIRTSLRDEWQFTFRSSELKEKAQEKVEHHRERLNHWQSEADTLREEYVKSVQEAAEKATTKEAQNAEQLAALTNEWLDNDAAGTRSGKFRVASSMPNFQPQQIEIMGDDELYGDLQKALGKVNEHRRLVESFGRWVKLFESDNGVSRKLTYSDVAFFGL